MDDSCGGPILGVFLGCGVWVLPVGVVVGFGYKPIQTASMDEMFDFILELQAFIRIVVVVPMVSTVLIVVLRVGGVYIH